MQTQTSEMTRRGASPTGRAFQAPFQGLEIKGINKTQYICHKVLGRTREIEVSVWSGIQACDIPIPTICWVAA